MVRDHRERLEDAIAGQRRAWTYVEVRPDDVQAALDGLPSPLSADRLADAIDCVRLAGRPVGLAPNLDYADALNLADAIIAAYDAGKRC